jgi:hypothetical protein
VSIIALFEVRVPVTIRCDKSITNASPITC